MLSAIVVLASLGRKLAIRSSVTDESLPGSWLRMTSTNQMPTTIHFDRRPLENLAIVWIMVVLTRPFHALAQRLIEGVVTPVELRLEIRGEHHRRQPACALF